MEHTIMGIIVLAIAASLILLAWVFTSKLRHLGIPKHAREAFAVTMITLGAYLGWVSSLFFQNELGHPNYEPEFWAIRIICLVACVRFVIAAYRCNGPLYPRDRDKE